MIVRIDQQLAVRAVAREVDLEHALRRHGKKRGLAALCIGGGEATAVAVELS